MQNRNVGRRLLTNTTQNCVINQERRIMWLIFCRNNRLTWSRTQIPTIHREQLLTYAIKVIESPTNCFRSQVISEEAENPFKWTFIIFGNRTWHVINFCYIKTLLGTIQDIVNTNVMNTIHSSLPVLAYIQHDLVQVFLNTRLKYVKKLSSIQITTFKS